MFLVRWRVGEFEENKGVLETEFEENEDHQLEWVELELRPEDYDDRL